MRLPRCLTIGGSDSGGGAGIQADLKTFEALGCFGMSALTALTAQNTREVRAIRELDPSFVAEQIDAVVDDIGVDAAKTGMLSGTAIVETVARKAEEHGFPLVVDPVMVSKSGAKLLKEDAIGAVIECLLPRAVLVTPNVPEAELLSGVRIGSLDDQVEAARRLARRSGAALVKGGHRPGPEVVDVLVATDEVYTFRRPRLSIPHTHGTGCVLSAAICARLARGDSLVEAVERAEEVLTRALRYALPLGRGHGPVQPLAELRNAAARYEVLEELRAALRRLVRAGPRELIPEVGSNLAVATPYAMGLEDVAGLDGRIVRTLDGIRAGEPRIGASRHMARFLLAVREWDPGVRAAMNIRYGEDVLAAIERAGLSVATFDRTGEPQGEGESLPWGAEQALRAFGGVPDLVVDRGAVGKEPMVRVLGRSADEVVDKVLRIHGHLREGA